MRKTKTASYITQEIIDIGCHNTYIMTNNSYIWRNRNKFHNTNIARKNLNLQSIELKTKMPIIYRKSRETIIREENLFKKLKEYK